MWYKWKGNPAGILRIKQYQVAFYDMLHGGTCFDESFFSPSEIEDVITFIEPDEDPDCFVRSRVFVHFEDGARYELKMVKDKEDFVMTKK